MKKREKKALAALGLAATMAFAVPAGAQDSKEGFYVGGSIGQAKQIDACEGVGGSFTCEDTDMAWRVLGGYQFNRYFAAELGYHNLGKAEIKGFGNSFTTEATALELVGIGAFPVTDQFSVYGKLGVYQGELKGTSSFGGSDKDTNTDLTFGLGVQYDITRQFGVRAEYQKYGDFGGDNVGKTDVDVVSIGVIFRFR